MLAYFPVPYQDELLYSVIARYGVHTGQTNSQKAVLRDVYGSASAVAIPDLPSHLISLTIQVEDVWSVTATDLIKRYTLGPLYFPFLNSLQTQRIVRSMQSDEGGEIHTRAGIAASSISQPTFFRYCPACVAEQYDTLGEPYWNRLHQITGVNVCIQHQCRLVSSDLYFHPKQKHLYQAATRTALQKSFACEEVPAIVELLVGRFHDLVHLQCIEGYSPYQWTGFYQNLAAQIGLMNGTRVDHSGIREKLFWDWKNTDFQDYVNNLTDGWLVSIFRKHRKSFHPLRHLMVWCSLLPEKSVSEIVRDVASLRVNKPIEPVKNIPSSDSCDSLTQAKRKEWLEVINQKRGCGVKEIRSIDPGGAIYSWLYRHDRGWLKENTPSRVKATSRYQVDYTTWDQQNIYALESYRNAVIENESRQRLSSNYLIKQLPRASSIEKHLADLPKTKEWLEINAESVVDFQIFRIDRAAELLREQSKPIIKWRLLRLAGIRPEMITPDIERFIQKLENSHGEFN